MKEINELNNLLSKYIDQGFFPGVQWQINIEDDHLFRRNWGLFRDRRVDLYKELLTLDGKIKD